MISSFFVLFFSFGQAQFLSPSPRTYAAPKNMKKISQGTQHQHPSTKKKETLRLEFKKPDRQPASEATKSPSEVESEPQRKLSEVDLSILFGSWVLSSQSDFAQRNYGVTGLSYWTQGQVWLARNWGIGMALRGSWLSDLGAPAQNGNRTPVQGDVTQMQVSYRKDFQESLLRLNLNYSDLRWRPNALSANRPYVQTSSWGINPVYEFPLLREKVTQQFGFQISPLASHWESPSVSGLHARTALWGVESRTKVFLRPSFSLVFHVEHSSEKNQFSGSSSAPDTTRATLVESVSVLQNSWFLGIGVHWSK